MSVEVLAEPSEKPNIIFLFSDDQRFDAMGFLHPVLETPNMDRLAAQGVYFPNAYVTTPICASSRASVLTGLHEQQHGFTFRTPPLNLNFLQNSYPKLLRDHGYTSGFVGKNGMRLDQERIELLFDYYVPVTRNPYFQTRDGEEIHATDYTAKKAKEFIQNTAEPFILSVWFNAPHAEDSDPAQFIPPQRYADQYAGVDFPNPPTSDPDFFLGLPGFLQDSLNRVRWSWRWTPELYDSMMSGYLAMIKGVDDAIGEILQQTVSSGVADNTVVIFMSDNGYFVGERGFAGKWLAYEPSIRVPLLVYDPRISADQQGRVLPELVLNIDLPETILDLAGIEIPRSMQGRSLMPLLNGDLTDWRKDFFIEHSFTYPPSVVIPSHEGLRTADLKYIHYLEQDHEELYDLKLDPFETSNLANDPAYQVQLNAFRQRTTEFKRFCNIDIVSGIRTNFDTSYEACEILVVGPDFIAGESSTISLSSGWEIEFQPGFHVEKGATLSANVCKQSLCMTSPAPMPHGCHSCIDQICDINSTCCGLEFDSTCVEQVGTVCGLVCEHEPGSE